MKDLEEELFDARAQLIWVLTEDGSFQPATSEDSHFYYRDTIGSVRGLRVGDGQGDPAGVFDSAPVITSGRGFVAIVRRADMQVLYAEDYSRVNTTTLVDLVVDLSE